jgi:hypothetical protein
MFPRLGFEPFSSRHKSIIGVVRVYDIIVPRIEATLRAQKQKYLRYVEVLLAFLVDM